MRRLLALALLCLFALPTMADDSTKDKDTLKGTWKITKVVVGGNTPPDAGDATLTITADDITPEIGGMKRPAAKYKLDATKSPKHIDLTTPEGETMQGIYELKEDTLRFCLQRKGGRPNSFDATGDDIMVIEAKKQK